MSIMDKLKKNSRSKYTAVLNESKILKGEVTPTSVPMINVALGGKLDGGLLGGLGVLAGPSKHFKTSFALLMVGEYLQANPDAVVLFYDSEFGSPESYFKEYNVDPSRVLHTPITNIEELKFDISHQLENLERSDKVIILIDSIGNLASKKEVEDAKDEKSVADMSRAKSLKSLFRMVTPHLSMKDIPLLAINHTYKEIGLYPKDIVGGGTGIYYSADWIWIIGRRQNKKGTDILGYDFIIKEEKSRFVKEQSKIPITVSWAGGVERFSGLLDVALAGGFIIKPSNGRYQKVDLDTGEAVGLKVHEKDTLGEDYWADLLADPRFQKFVEDMYCIGSGDENTPGSETFIEEEL
jgi:RecA/RadA recombinase